MLLTLINATEPSSYLSVGSALAASGTIIIVLVGVIRDQFKKQNQTFENLVNEIKAEIHELRKEIRTVEKTSSDRTHDMEVRLTRVESILQANGCLTGDPMCSKTK